MTIKQAMLFTLAVMLPLLVLTASVSQAQSPNASTSYYKRGVERFRKGDLDGAITFFDKVIELNLADSSALESESKMTGDNDDRVVMELGEMVVTIPRTAAAYYVRGLARLRKGEFDEALADLTRSLKIAPRNAEAWFDVGLVK